MLLASTGTDTRPAILGPSKNAVGTLTYAEPRVRRGCAPAPESASIVSAISVSLPWNRRERCSICCRTRLLFRRRLLRQGGARRLEEPEQERRLRHAHQLPRPAVHRPASGLWNTAPVRLRSDRGVAVTRRRRDVAGAGHRRTRAAGLGRFVWKRGHAPAELRSRGWTERRALRRVAARPDLPSRRQHDGATRTSRSRSRPTAE